MGKGMDGWRDDGWIGAQTISWMITWICRWIEGFPRIHQLNIASRDSTQSVLMLYFPTFGRHVNLPIRKRTIHYHVLEKLRSLVQICVGPLPCAECNNTTPNRLFQPTTPVPTPSPLPYTWIVHPALSSSSAEYNPRPQLESVPHNLKPNPTPNP